MTTNIDSKHPVLWEHIFCLETAAVVHSEGLMWNYMKESNMFLNCAHCVNILWYVCVCTYSYYLRAHQYCAFGQPAFSNQNGWYSLSPLLGSTLLNLLSVSVLSINPLSWLEHSSTGLLCVIHILAWMHSVCATHQLSWNKGLLCITGLMKLPSSLTGLCAKPCAWSHLKQQPLSTCMPSFRHLLDIYWDACKSAFSLDWHLPLIPPQGSLYVLRKS